MLGHEIGHQSNQIRGDLVHIGRVVAGARDVAVTGAYRAVYEKQIAPGQPGGASRVQVDVQWSYFLEVSKSGTGSAWSAL